ncbi:MAG TPA: hypothetical protein DCX01_01045 [Bacteroidetes bacterium]|nr:hypothetical protein [Bacteroidota bacterium]
METNTNTTAAPVMVEQILSTRNPEIFQLMLRQEVEKPAAANPLGFFLEGYPGVGDGIERRVSYQSVSKHVMEKYNITEGVDFSIAIGKSCKLLVTETFEQRTWTNSDGTKGAQNPKVNPSTAESLTQGGKPIYRNCTVTFDLATEDTFIAHDKAGVAQASPFVSTVDDLTV